MDGTAGTLPGGRVRCWERLRLQARDVVGRGAAVAADERARVAALEARVEVEVGVERDPVLDAQVLVADHAAGAKELAAGHEAVRLVEGERALDAVEQLCAPGRRLVAQADARAPGAVVQRADEPPPLLVKQEKPVGFGARQVVDLGAAGTAATD